MKKNSKITIVGYTPFEHQRYLHDEMAKYKSHTTFLVKSRRQVGKSIMLLNELLRRAVSFQKSKSICVSPSYKQAKKLYKEAISAISGNICFKKGNDTDLILEFINGSIIMFVTAGATDNLRGETIKMGGILAIDEAAFIPDDIFYGILLPMTNVYHSNILITSTPKFKNGFFYDIYKKGIEGDPNVKVIDFCQFDTSKLLDDETLAYYRRTLPKDIFRNEYMGEFIENNSTVFGDYNDILLPRSRDISLQGLHMGVDWGTGSGADMTAITIMNNEREMVDLVYFNDKDAKNTILEIEKLVDKYDIQKITVEGNSIGKVYLDLLRDALQRHGYKKRVYEFTTTNTSKNKIINNLQVAIQEKNIKLIDDLQLKIQMSAYECQSTKNGKVTYNAANGYHDDIIMSLAICLDSMTKVNYIIR